MILQEQSLNRASGCIFTGSPFQLADESAKQNLLYFLNDQKEAGILDILAFCLTDHALYLMTKNTFPLPRGAKERYSIILPAKYPVCVRLELTENILLDGRDAILTFCRKIHYIPVDRGLTRQVRDYWWSSYRSYLDYYNWPCLNREPVLLLFDPVHSRAVRKFRKFHESAPSGSLL